MGLNFFWRCESETLDGTHDFSIGDTTAGPQGTAQLNGTAAKVGSNGIYTAETGDIYGFDVSGPQSNRIVDRLTGCYGVWVYTAEAMIDTNQFVYCRGSHFNDHIALACSGTDEFSLRIRNNPVGAVVLPTTTVNATVGNWYFVIGRWDHPNTKRKIEVYDSNMNLIQQVEDTVTGWTAPDDLSEAFRIGGLNTFSPYIDNVFVGNAYNEPIQNYANITSFTQYPKIRRTTIKIGAGL